jgi:hypothetical protein
MRDPRISVNFVKWVFVDFWKTRRETDGQPVVREVKRTQVYT